ncbi:MAG: guanylate kinase [Elusimicrobia bacterium CG08_land_8_20_14_0_20_44_26]|nr:MAG: guanylate kinase [Elusimicrobia bacterium CG08_land_8_20_14_0_20_44_26]
MDKIKTPGIFVLSSPSGGGKTTLVRYMQKKFPDVIYSVSTTTRPIRPGEKAGLDYNFITVRDFRKGIKEGTFAEWAVVHGNYYGTPVENIISVLRKGKSILLDLDVKGARNIKKLFPGANLIFITAASIKELRRRLLARGQDDIKIINRRLKNARRELKQMKYFDYLIINEDVDRAKKTLDGIYLAAESKVNKKYVNELAERIIAGTPSQSPPWKGGEDRGGRTPSQSPPWKGGEGGKRGNHPLNFSRLRREKNGKRRLWYGRN